MLIDGHSLTDVLPVEAKRLSLLRHEGKTLTMSQTNKSASKQVGVRKHIYRSNRAEHEFVCWLKRRIQSRRCVAFEWNLRLNKQSLYQLADDNVGLILALD